MSHQSTINCDPTNPNRAKLRGASRFFATSETAPQSPGKVPATGTMNRCEHGCYLPKGETKAEGCWECRNSIISRFTDAELLNEIVRRTRLDRALTAHVATALGRS